MIKASLPLHPVLSQLGSMDVGAVSFNEELSRHNTWKIGGPAAVLVEPGSETQVQQLVLFARQHQVPLVVIGQGSNLLFDDRGVHGIVLKIGARMAQLDIDEGSIVAGGGAWVPQLARKSMAAGLTGLEHCIGIPGTLGGLVMMNGGSQRHGIGENVVNVTCVMADGSIQILSQKECHFAYRHSALQGLGCIVTAAELFCAKGDGQVIRRSMIEDLQNRRHKFPRKMPNCGSVFLSTAAMHASVGPPGKIIEECGLKGTRCGAAEVSHQHANFIVNTGQASSADVLELIAHIRKTVMSRIGFELCCEVRYVSPEGDIRPAHLAI